MRPPEFWKDKDQVEGRDSAVVLKALLTPVSWAYAAVAAQRQRTTISRHAPVPVVCIGNFTVGGAGKTPISRAIRAKLGPHTHTLSRGYGGRAIGPLRVTPDMEAGEVGDEPLLHARDGAAWVSRDRFAGALAAAQAGAHVIVMDDGFQNPALAKDLSIVAVDPAYGVGNGQVFPAGPLREPLSAGLARADAIVMLHNTWSADTPEQPEWLNSFRRPVLHAALSPVGDAPTGTLVAFAGLARPEKFFDTLEAVGAEVADVVPYPDHHPYTEDDLTWLAQMAEERSARLITTEKDAARLSPAWRERVAVLPVAARFADEAALDALLAPIQSRITAAHGEA
ncbi:MAG: tetraacyldisaccharide 4'-kinase [Caulobacteraceae bacterium]|nr:tetraacyldisaccharide 4'-kinase [Caulobacteraceae bacterium]